MAASPGPFIARGSHWHLTGSGRVLGGKGSRVHQDGFIYDPRRHFGYIGNLMAIEAKAFDNLTVDALIGEERHWGIVSRG